MLPSRFMRFLLGLLPLFFLATFAGAAPTPGSVTLTDSERQWLKAHPVITLAPDPDFKPIEYFDKNNTYQGAAADIIRILEKKLGISITIARLKNWDEAMAKFKNHEVDLLGAMVRTPNREKFALFTETLVAVPGGIFVRSGSPANLALKDLKGKKVAVVSNYAAHDIIRNQYPEITLEVVQDVSTGLAKASLGMVDAYVENMANATFYSQEAGITNLQVVGRTEFDYQWGIGIRKDWPELQSILNKGLAAISEEERQQAIQRWIFIDGQHWRPTKTFIIGTVASSLGVLLLLVVYWNYSLRKVVRNRTSLLQQELEERQKAEAALKNLTGQLEERVRERTAELNNEIGERIKSEQQLKASEENYRCFAELTSDYVHKCSRAGTAPFRLQWMGGAVSAISGYSAEEIYEFGCWLPIAHPDDRQMVASHLASFVLGEQKQLEFRLVTKQGQTRWICEKSRCEAGRSEGELILYGAASDITERKLAEEEIRNSEKLMSSLYNITQYPFTKEGEFLDHALNEIIRITGSRIGYIYFYDEQKRQFTLNTWSQDVMKECSVLEQSTIYDLDSTGIWGEAVRQRKPIVLNDFQAGHPLKKGMPDGHVILKRFLTIPVIRDEVIVAVAGVSNKESNYSDSDVMLLKLFMDSVWMIVEQQRAEEGRRHMENQLLHAQKLESLGVLAGGIAHDFNNILMVVIGNAELALMRINKESPAVENLHRIEQAAVRAADLAKQMLAYSGKGKFVVENLDLNILLQEMLHMLEVSISKKAVLRLNQYASLPPVEADATQLRQIIMNLVINASEAIGDKSGVIAITTGCMDCDRSYLKGVWLDENLIDGLYVYLEIADSGCGMDKETMAKLFDPFFTTKFTGRGLGMAAVLGIVRGHKGAIKVYSEPGKGTSFKILLPASGKPSELFNHVRRHDGWQGSGTVLLVDDEETVRGIGAEMLKELGFTTITANDGRQALEIFKATPDISIVILDLTMPHMDGEQCFRELRQFKPDVKVIMSSGYNEQEVTQRFVGKGLAGFVQKPYKLSVLKEAIRKL